MLWFLLEVLTDRLAASLQALMSSWKFFYPLNPPSLSQSADTQPRPIPSPADVPKVPTDEACTNIDPRDM